MDAHHLVPQAPPPQGLRMPCATGLAWASGRFAARGPAPAAPSAGPDERTGLPDRREAMRVLALESERADCCTTCLWVAVVDAGPAAGDAALGELARLLQKGMRSADQVFRWGPEQFLLLLVHHPDGDAVTPLRRLRHAVQRHDWHRLAPGLRLSVCIGVGRRQAGETPERLLRRVEAALCRAKHDEADRLQMA